MAQSEISDLSETDASNTTISDNSTDGSVANMGTMDNVIQAMLGMLKRWFKSSLFRLRDGTDQTKLLAFDVSAIPTGTTQTLVVPAGGGTLSISGSPEQRRNRIVNGDMRVSQENGNTSGTSSGRFGADQWSTHFVTSAGTITTVRGASTASPAGSPYRYRVTITAADASLAAGEYLAIRTNLEGLNVADFRYGGASAKTSVFRFGFKGPAGTYAARVRNAAFNRSFVALFTIAGGDANTDTVQTIPVTGDTTGTWLTGEGDIGLTLDIVLACGSTFQGVTGWQAGNIFGTSAVTNGMGTVSSVFELFDVGFKLDPDSTGVYGAYEVDEVHPVYRPERYFTKVTGLPDGARLAVGQSDSTSSASVNAAIPMDVAMCKTPTVTRSGFQVSSTTANIAITALAVSGLWRATVLVTVTVGAATLNGFYQLRSTGTSDHLTFDARL